MAWDLAGFGVSVWCSSVVLLPALTLGAVVFQRLPEPGIFLLEAPVVASDLAEQIPDRASLDTANQRTRQIHIDVLLADPEPPPTASSRSCYAAIRTRRD